MLRSFLKTHQALLVVAGIVVLATLITVGGSTLAQRSTKYVPFTRCIRERGAVMYGAFWCPHCQAQKARFAAGKRELPYVECALPQGGRAQACVDAGVHGYPTWVFADGSRHEGELTLDELAGRTGCALPE